MLNTHGLKIKGIKAASGETLNWYDTGWHTQISYDTETGRIYTGLHLGDSWTQWDDDTVITVCHTTRHMTMQEIADAIARAMALMRA